MRRRSFVSLAALPAGAAIPAPSAPPLEISGRIGDLQEEEGKTPLEGARWYSAREIGAGLSFRFPAGALAKARYLTADFLLDGKQKLVFSITLAEGEKGRKFHFRFSGLNQCSFRMRMPLALVDQNRWGIDREGAFLKPRVSGDRVDLPRVDRITFTLQRKGLEPARWAMTPLAAVEHEVTPIERPLLPKGPLIDELGQSTIHDWPAKTRSVEEMVARVRRQHEEIPRRKWPEDFTKWGGWRKMRVNRGAGFFRTHFDGRRWWLVDPEGYAFWSAGVDCVRVDSDACYSGLETAFRWLPENDPTYRDAFYTRSAGGRQMKFVRFLAINMIRALGPADWHSQWGRIALAEMRALGFNTVGNWSEWEFARRAKFPYVRPMSFQPRRVRMVYRDFPDVYHPDFEQDAADYAATLADTASDPALIGYFLMNEPQWAFSSELPAAGMLYTAPRCATREQLSRFLRTRYSSDAALSAAWGFPVSLQQVAAERFTAVLSPSAIGDLEEFSVLMTRRYFDMLSQACRKVDPNHLNLGMRWQGVPKTWAVPAMQSFDVFSMNCYQPRVPRDVTARIRQLLNRPVIVGEWHFGTLDVGLPASGIGHLRNQRERALAYRVYLENAAADPNCVGVHWFTLYDQSALGRFDGENYNIGFLDICNRPYEEMSAAAQTSHGRLYEVVSGAVPPFDENLEYLPVLS